MTTGMLQDTIHTSPPTMGPRFRPYASPDHHVTKGRYITSNDPRGYIPVYEYPLNGQWIMMDIDDGYILWTGIWKALGNSKADIVKMIDSQPELAPLIRRVRGGYLKIQGTWMPYEVALRLSRRVAWQIREDLIPLFGPTFPSTCLSPDQPGYGQVVASGPGRRRARRNTQPVLTPAHGPREHTHWTVVTPASALGPPGSPSSSPNLHHYSSVTLRAPDQYSNHNYSVPGNRSEGYSPTGKPDSQSPPFPLSRDRGSQVRYSPYSGHSAPPARRPPSSQKMSLPPLEMPPPPHRNFPHHSQHTQGASPDSQAEGIVLPPIQPPARRNTTDSPYALPPISALEDLRGIHTHDSAAVLRRLAADDKPQGATAAEPRHWPRRYSSASSHSFK
ncbi:transcription regulator HTH, apses-type DNA-binding domain-containing protein [Infundibulicybe gibba]|nr:transcription regulator HTH, apses-type DNA-binding domain-containing protein [Infundibulicybe gibba]